MKKISSLLFAVLLSLMVRAQDSVYLCVAGYYNFGEAVTAVARVFQDTAAADPQYTDYTMQKTEWINTWSIPATKVPLNKFVQFRIHITATGECYDRSGYNKRESSEQNAFNISKFCNVDGVFEWESEGYGWWSSFEPPVPTVMLSILNSEPYLAGDTLNGWVDLLNIEDEVIMGGSIRLNATLLDANMEKHFTQTLADRSVSIAFPTNGKWALSADFVLADATVLATSDTLEFDVTIPKDIVNDSIKGYIHLDTDNNTITLSNTSMADPEQLPETGITTPDTAVSIVVESKNTIVTVSEGIVCNGNLTISAGTSDDTPADTLFIASAKPITTHDAEATLTIDGVSLVLSIPSSESPAGKPAARHKGSTPTSVISGFQAVTLLNCKVISPASATYNTALREFVDAEGNAVTHLEIGLNRQATSCEQAISVGKTTRKVIVDGKLYILRDGKVYDARGFVIKK